MDLVLVPRWDLQHNICITHVFARGGGLAPAHSFGNCRIIIEMEPLNTRRWYIYANVTLIAITCFAVVVTGRW